MKISDLTEGTGNVEIEAKVVSIGEEKEINKYGRKLRVAKVDIEDDTGTIKLALWNNNIDKVKEGAKIKVSNGYVTTFQGELQLTLGRFGSVEVVE